MTDVSCAGILVADTFCGPLDTLPAEGQLMAVDAMPTKVGGCAANVSIDLAKQGLSVEAIGCIGRDAAADVIMKALSSYGIGCRGVLATDQQPTSQTMVLLVKGQDRRYLHMFGANRCFNIDQIDRELVMSSKVFYLGGLCVLPCVDYKALVGLLVECRQCGVVTVVDVVMTREFKDHEVVRSLLPYIDYFVPNDDEASLLTGESDPSQQLRALLNDGANAIVVTCSDEGAIAGRGGIVWRIPGFSTDVVDPSGTGDAFCAGLITGICRGLDLPDSLRIASALGASAATALGTTDGVFDHHQLEVFLSGRATIAHNVSSI